MKNADKPIYPTLMQQVGDNEFEPTNLHPKSSHQFIPEHSKMTGGLTKREYFAGLAMQGMLSNSGTSNYLKGNIDLLVPELVSKFAIEYADELLKQLENE